MDTIKISPKKIVWFLSLGVAVLAILHAISYVPLIRGTRDSYIHMLNMDSEQNLPSLFSTTLLWLCAFFAGCIARATAAKGDRLQWAGLAFVFLFLGVDESVSFHERLNGPLMAASESLSLGWVIPYAVLVLVLAMAYWRFLFRQPPATKKWIIIGGALFVAGALGFEIVGGRIKEFQEPGFWYYLMVACEELLEMSGCIAFIYGFSHHLDTRFPELRFRITES